MRIRVSQWEYGYCGGHVVAVEGMWVLWRACGCYGGHVGAMEGMWVL